jgi:branched-chain amino acid transport system substrate-binding protein
MEQGLYATAPLLGSGRKSAVWIVAALVALSSMGGGCPRRAPLAPLEIIGSPDPHAEADFRAAKDAEARGDLDTAAQRYRAFIEVWPEDPLEPVARLQLGIIDLTRGDPANARAWFDGVASSQDPTLRERGRMYGAVARSRAGDHLDALSVLRPLVGRTIDPRETALLLRTIAEAEEAIGNRLAALEARDRELSGELSQEQAETARIAVRRLTEALSPDLELPRAYETLSRDGSAWPEVARRLIAVSQERGDTERVRAVADDLRTQGISLDEALTALVIRAERSGGADLGVVGAILPLSGRAREVGESTMRGLMIASGLPSDTPRPEHTPRIVFRDDRGDPAVATKALEDLVALHRVIAVIGPVGTAVSRAVEERARELGVPLISLSPAAPSPRDARDPVFRLFPNARAETEQLAAYATAQGAKRVAMLHPVGGYGDAMRAAMEAALATRGASLLEPVTYEATATSFLQEAEAIERQRPDALFVADSAAKVALLAPALAARGVWPKAEGAQSSEGRAIPWLISASGFDPSLAQSSRRYLQGAVFAVPFDPKLSPNFAQAYEAQWGTAPNLFSALGHDAYRFVQAALTEGAETREEVTTTLLSVRATRVVGANDGFTPSHGPRTPTRLETLNGDMFVPLAR